MKRYVCVLLALLFLLVPAAVLGAGISEGHALQRPAFEGGLLGGLDARIAAGFPARESLARWNLTISVMGGQREYDHIFIFGDELIPILDPPLYDQVYENILAILTLADFVEYARVPVYCMIIPNVSALRQPILPHFLLGQNINQQQFIEDVYAQMFGRVTVVDAYGALSAAKEQYIFYRTENNLTALGGFYLYYALGGRLLEGIARPSLQNYDIEHVAFDFFGDLYERAPSQSARADTLSVFRYRNPLREHVVVVSRGGVSRTYHTIFPLHKLELEGNRAMEIYLGGGGSITTITTSSPQTNNLLVIGDRTALAFVPFLVNHYRTVTLLDLSQMCGDEFGLVSQAIAQGFYDQILFAYSIETFMHSPYPATAVNLIPEAAYQGD